MSDVKFGHPIGAPSWWGISRDPIKTIHQSLPENTQPTKISIKGVYKKNPSNSSDGNIYFLGQDTTFKKKDKVKKFTLTNFDEGYHLQTTQRKRWLVMWNIGWYVSN